MLLLIDGDVLCYGACERRFDPAKVIERPVFTPTEDLAYLERSWKNLKSNLNQMCGECFADDYLMAVKAKTNFRDRIYPVWFDECMKAHGYKSTRVKHPFNFEYSCERLLEKWKAEGIPESEYECKLREFKEAFDDKLAEYEFNKSSVDFVNELRRRLVEEGIAIEAEDREADDFLQIWAQQAREADEDFAVVTIDKDLKVIGGTFYNPKLQKVEIVSPEEGLRFFYRQLLMGDPVDSIPGIPGIGPKKADKALETCEDEEELRFQVQHYYEANFGDQWRDYLLSNGKLLYLQKHEHDFFSLQDW